MPQLGAIRDELAAVFRRGLWRTAHMALVESWFHLIFRANTQFLVARQDLDITDDDDKIHAIGHYPVRYYHLALALDGTEFACRGRVFVDFGCGAGRAILFASRLPLNRIIGVDISPSLCQTTRTNLEQYYKRREKTVPSWEVVESNARTYQIPDDADIFYFYHPFDEVVMNDVIDNIVNSVRRTPRDCVIVYMNPVCADLLIAKGFRPLSHRTAGFQYFTIFKMDTQVVLAEKAAPAGPSR